MGLFTRDCFVLLERSLSSNLYLKDGLNKQNALLIEPIGNPVNHSGKIALAKLELMRVNTVPKGPWKH